MSRFVRRAACERSKLSREREEASSSFKPDISGSWVYVPEEVAEAIATANPGCGTTRPVSYDQLLNILEVIYKQ